MSCNVIPIIINSLNESFKYIWMCVWIIRIISTIIIIIIIWLLCISWVDVYSCLFQDEVIIKYATKRQEVELRSCIETREQWTLYKDANEAEQQYWLQRLREKYLRKAQFTYCCNYLSTGPSYWWIIIHFINIVC